MLWFVLVNEHIKYVACYPCTFRHTGCGQIHLHLSPDTTSSNIRGNPSAMQSQICNVSASSLIHVADTNPDPHMTHCLELRRLLYISHLQKNNTSFCSFYKCYSRRLICFPVLFSFTVCETLRQMMSNVPHS